MTDKELKFNPENHQYSVGNTIFPSITQILKAEGFIDSRWYNEEAMNKGTIVHLILHQFDSGILIEDEVDKQYVPYLESYKAFLSDTKKILLNSELPMFHEYMGYAGTPDKVFNYEDIYEMSVVEIKTGQPASWHQLQTAAQEILVRASYSANENEHIRLKRHALYLSNKGKYKVITHNDRSDHAIWKSAVSIHNWKRNKQGG